MVSLVVFGSVSVLPFSLYLGTVCFAKVVLSYVCTWLSSAVPDFFQLVQMLSEPERSNKITIQSSPDYIIFSKE